MNPDEKLVEARIVVSSLIRSDSKSQVQEYFYRFENLQKGFRVVDYLPKTELTLTMVPVRLSTISGTRA